MNHGESLNIQGVRQFFGVKGARVQALSKIDLVIEPGQFVCLAGPSGCGKTTLLRLVAGFMRPSEGTITVGGKPVTKPGPDRGMVFQAPNLYPWFHVRGNVELGLLRKAAERITRLKLLVKLDGLDILAAVQLFLGRRIELLRRPVPRLIDLRGQHAAAADAKRENNR